MATPLPAADAAQTPACVVSRSNVANRAAHRRQENGCAGNGRRQCRRSRWRSSRGCRRVLDSGAAITPEEEGPGHQEEVTEAGAHVDRLPVMGVAA